MYARRGKKYAAPKAGEARSTKRAELLGCCDCGLVHLVKREVNPEGILVERWWRDNRSTALLRRHKARKDELIKEDNSNAYVLILRIRQKRARKPLHVRYEPVPAERRRKKATR